MLKSSNLGVKTMKRLEAVKEKLSTEQEKMNE